MTRNYIDPQREDINMKPHYEAALNVYRAASAKYRAVSADYRARKCNDETFIAACKEFKAAQSAMDDVERTEMDFFLS